ncbi:hypothetical protein XELAEV_18033283mg [Xenopus laevis]|uniref:Uncharacterized protein n=1 Tax=Xenopus laevis TaxID=8355 RepID=A0A974CJ20_XENLA|nr:hypothetical protein XELAEV_18033283mg [Xenopus laevis]
MASRKKNRAQVSRNGPDLLHPGSQDSARNSAAPKPHSASESAGHRSIAASTAKKLGRYARDQMETNTAQDSGDAASPLYNSPRTLPIPRPK